LLETIENRFQGRDYLVELGAPEFTSICPLTDAPDFGELTIRYVPDGKLYELKSLRDYLTSFRGRKIFQEEVVNEVLDQLVADGAPRLVEVEGEFAARGGMTTRVVASSGQLPESWISDGAGAPRWSAAPRRASASRAPRRWPRREPASSSLPGARSSSRTTPRGSAEWPSREM
jgi:7-cyano-7-deazaguanine reductase